MAQHPDAPVELVIGDVDSKTVLHRANCTTATVATEAIRWVRGWEAVRLERLEPAIVDQLGCGRPESGFAILINRPNRLVFYAKRT